MSPVVSGHRPMEAYVRRDAISWWAGVRYVHRQVGEVYIGEYSTMTGWGARWKAKRLLRKYRRRQARGILDIDRTVI